MNLSRPLNPIFTDKELKSERLLPWGGVMPDPRAPLLFPGTISGTPGMWRGLHPSGSGVWLSPSYVRCAHRSSGSLVQGWRAPHPRGGSVHRPALDLPDTQKKNSAKSQPRRQVCWWWFRFPAWKERPVWCRMKQEPQGQGAAVHTVQSPLSVCWLCFLLPACAPRLQCSRD